jgi:hypothetical protein
MPSRARRGSIIPTVGKWAIGFFVALAACVPLFLTRSAAPLMLQDTDTAVLLESIRERQDPWSWFGGDWPLGNHFYRPISTLTFELDNSLYGSAAAGYGTTNAILAILCVLALFWFVRELSDRIELALPAAILFALWIGGWHGWLPSAALWAGWAALLLALLPGRRWGQAVLAALILFFLSMEFEGLAMLRWRMIEWLPGRTASVMTLFALLALASYARYERLGAVRRAAPDPGPLDPPATKGTQAAAESRRLHTIWGWAACLFAALSLGSYEQAVMLPALLLGAGVCLWLQGRRVRWGWHAAFWGLLMGYVALRSALVPGDVSGYQAQQFRTGPGVWRSVLDYAVPGAVGLWQGLVVLDLRSIAGEGGLLGWLYSLPYGAALRMASTVGAAWAARREWHMPLTGWALSTLAFLPMAWLKHFDHYHFLPMALRAFFVAAMLAVAGKTLVNAASLPALPAPPRLDPAPGSLPRR